MSPEPWSDEGRGPPRAARVPAGTDLAGTRSCRRLPASRGPVRRVGPGPRRTRAHRSPEHPRQRRAERGPAWTIDLRGPGFAPRGPGSCRRGSARTVAEAHARLRRARRARRASGAQAGPRWRAQAESQRQGPSRAVGRLAGRDHRRPVPGRLPRVATLQPQPPGPWTGSSRHSEAPPADLLGGEPDRRSGHRHREARRPCAANRVPGAPRLLEAARAAAPAAPGFGWPAVRRVGPRHERQARRVRHPRRAAPRTSGWSLRPLVPRGAERGQDRQAWGAGPLARSSVRQLRRGATGSSRERRGRCG